MILKAKHHFIIYPFFIWYSIIQTRRKFGKVYWDGTFSNQKMPVLLITNHVSWWDGFWAVVLNEKFLHRKFHVMILEEQLRKHWYFNYCGGFSIRKNDRSMIETMQYAGQLLEDPRNLVLIFPQGEIQSIYQPFFHFEKGIERILKGKEGKVQVVFSVNMVDFLSQPKPGLYVYSTEEPDMQFTRDVLQERYNAFYRQCLEKQMQLKS